MAFTYHFCDGTNDRIDFIRAMIADTVDVNPEGVVHTWEDSEIEGFYRMVGMVWQSSMQYSGTMGVANLPSPPVSIFRVAAAMLDAQACNGAKLAGALELLDAKVNLSDGANLFHQQAAAMREIDDNSGSFAIVEQTNTIFAYRDKFWAGWQRQIGGIS